MRMVLQSGLLWLLLAFGGCGGGSINNAIGPGPTPSPAPSPSPTPQGTPVTAEHVVLVVLENHSFSEVIGNPSMPFFNSLASAHSLATNYFSDVHPSLPDYFLLTTGQMETTTDSFTGIVSDDNVVRALTAVGKSWRGYMEAIPSAGYLGNDVFPYLKQHDPLVYLSDVVNSSAMAGNVVPLTQLAADLSANALPNFSLIIPDAENDAHSCVGNAPSCPDSGKLARTDAWLQNNINPLINSPAFSNGVLIITWDEGDLSDTANGGGQVATVLLGANVKTAFQSVTFYQHESTLRLIMTLLQTNDFPGGSASAPSMAEFFQ